MSFAPPTSRPRSASDSCRKQAVLQHRRRRFQLADTRIGRQLQLDSRHEAFACEDERAHQLFQQCDVIEDRIGQAEDQLAGLVGDMDLVAALRQLLREPASLEAAAAAAVAELRATPSAVAASSLISLPGRRSGVPVAGVSLPSRRQCQGYVSEELSHDLELITGTKVKDPPNPSEQTGNQSCKEELEACRIYTQQAMDKQYQLTETTQNELSELKGALAATQELLQGDVHMMRNLVSECQMGLAELQKLDPEISNRLSRLEADHKSSYKDDHEFRDALNKCSKTFHEKLESLAVEHTSQLREVSRGLVCLTSDFDLLEARFGEQLSALVAGQERQARALQGHMVVSAPSLRTKSDSIVSLGQSSHERVTNEAGPDDDPGPDATVAKASASKLATGLVGNLLGKCLHDPQASQGIAGR